MNLDNLLVGKLLGITALGLYAIAFNIANFSADYFSAKVHRVTFPAYSKLQDNLDNIRSAVFKTLKYVSIITIPFGVGLFLLSGEFLYVVYGEKWIGAIDILKILAWAGIFNTLSISFGSALLACGKSKLWFLVVALQVAIFCVFIVPMARLFGINGVGMVVGISGLVALITTLILVMRLLSLRFSQIYSSLKPALFSSLAMAVGIIFIKNILPCYKAGPFFYYNFTLLSIFSVCVYAFSLHKVEKSLFSEIRCLVFK